MQAMIFAAGLGTRFKPWTNNHPKALAIINGKSLLQRNVEFLQEYGIVDVIVNVHHFADQIISAVEENNGWGSKIIISDERNEVLETGGGLMKARSLFKSDEPFITMNADILTDLSIEKMLSFHSAHQSDITLAISNRISSRRFLWDRENRLSGWENEKTNENKITRAVPVVKSMAFNCVAVFQPGIFEEIQQRGKFSLTETFLSLSSTHQIMGFEQINGKFIDVGKPESVAVAEKLFGNDL